MILNNNMEIQDIINTIERYNGFIILDEPTPFSIWRENQDEEYVQVHDMDTCGGDTPVGFCGVFKWENNKLVSLDNDTYWKDMLVYAYSYWEHDGIKGLDILVEDW